MPVCSVPTCATTHRTSDITLYRFPKDAKYSRLWVRCCMKKDSFNTKNAFICSLHFSEDAYQRDINHDILGYSSRKNLKKDAMPTLQLPSLRMFQKSILETRKFDDAIPSLLPKNILKNIEFDYFSSSWVNKNREKVPHFYNKCCTESMLCQHAPEVSLNLTAENAENILEKEKECVSLSEEDSGNQKDPNSL